MLFTIISVHPVNEYKLLGDVPAHEENGDGVFSKRLSTCDELSRAEATLFQTVMEWGIPWIPAKKKISFDSFAQIHYRFSRGI